MVNIPGNEVKDGEVLSEYGNQNFKINIWKIILVGAGPPAETGILQIYLNNYKFTILGLHRYVYLVYQQKGKIQDAEHGHLTNRSGKF